MIKIDPAESIPFGEGTVEVIVDGRKHVRTVKILSSDKRPGWLLVA